MTTLRGGTREKEHKSRTLVVLELCVCVSDGMARACNCVGLTVYNTAESR
jgi:hypothetical protein